MKYVPEPNKEITLKFGEETILEGEQKYITVLFCDIRGFTSLSENLSPKQVVSFLNDYYNEFTQIIQKHNGSVIQYVGDEIFAAFGAPVEYPNNEENAVYCSRDMINNLYKISDKYRKLIGDEVNIGIGINSGEVVAGNLGSEVRISYALTGDTVNTGKRIESLTIDQPNKILISENVYDKVKEKFHIEKWEPVSVKGKAHKIVVYEIKDSL
jgi:class 3 adenylate cyclase